VKYQGDWVYSIIFIDGYSRMILAGKACLKQDLSHIIAVLQRALTQYGCPKQIVSDNGGVFKSLMLERAIDILGIDWHKIEKGRPWQNLMESFFSVQYRMLDSYVKASDDLKYIQRQHGRFVDEYNISGHWHHKSYTEDGRIYYKSPQTILGSAKGKVSTSQDLSKIFAFRHYQRVVSRKGQIRILGYILYVDEGLADETVDVYIYPDCLQIEHDKQIIVEYECHYDIQMNQLKTVKSDMVFWHPSVSRQLFIFSSQLYRIVFFRRFIRQFVMSSQAKQLSFHFMEF